MWRACPMDPVARMTSIMWRSCPVEHGACMLCGARMSCGSRDVHVMWIKWPTCPKSVVRMSCGSRGQHTLNHVARMSCGSRGAHIVWIMWGIFRNWHSGRDQPLLCFPVRPEINNIADGSGSHLAAFVYSFQELLYSDGVTEYTFMQTIL